MNRYITELIGTYFLVLVIGMVVVAGSPAAPLAIGLGLTALVYMGGHVSGAHYNPAVTLSLYLRGWTERADVLPYIAAQLFGAWAAATTVQLLTGRTFPLAPTGEGFAAPLLAEMLGTFVLCLVILNVATSKATEGNGYYGVAIGFTVAGLAYALGGVSGAAFNPAVGTGPIVVAVVAGEGTLSDLWLYWAGPILGGLGAVPVFRLQEGPESGP